MGGGEAMMGESFTNFAVAVTIIRNQKSTPSTATEALYYYHNDHLGTPLFMSDETGAIVWRWEQTPFGEDTFQRGVVIENLRFPGQYYDSETGLAQNWHRDYSQKLGRYVEADPTGQWGGINIYIYAKCSPNRYFDFNGLNACDDIKKSADQLADSMLKGGYLKTCKCANQWNRDKMDCEGSEIDDRNDSEARYYKCMWNALATLRKCLGIPDDREDKLTPPPGSEIPNPGPGRGKKMPNNPDRDRRYGGK